VQRLRVRDGCFRDPQGAPVYLIGANFWPSRTGPWMYRDPWNAPRIEQDFAELRTLGANAVRIFCFLPDFLPSPDVVDGRARERLAETVGLAARAELWSIPTFLVGHMSGENWAPGWGENKNWYTDPVVLDACELLIGTIVSHFARDERIAAWLLTNEWPLFAGQIDQTHSTRWAQRLIAVARAADPECAVSVGDGAWDVIIGQPGVPHSPALRELVDFFGPHFYPKETDAFRHSAFAGFAMKMVQPLGRPVLLEEFGCSSDQVDDELGAAYYRTTLWSAFGADRPPYFHHPYELHFGLIRTDGSHKPQALEFARFAKLAKEHDPDEWQRAPASAAIARGAYYSQDFPFDWGWSKPQMRDILLQAYVYAIQAGVDVGFLDLPDARYGDCRTLFVPCLWQVTDDDVRGIERFARDGGTVYISYGGEPWFPDLGALVGARLLIRYGLVEDLGAQSVELRFVRDLGEIASGDRFRFDVRGDQRRCAPVRCVPRKATVVACDERENPVLLEHRLGLGRVIFMTHPLEYYLVNSVEANPASELGLLYRAIAKLGSDATFISEENPSVQTFVWHSTRTAARRVLFVNHGWEETVIRPWTGRAMIDVETGDRVGSVLTLEAKGVRLLETTPEA
jgi:hypothetical protein